MSIENPFKPSKEKVSEQKEEPLIEIQKTKRGALVTVYSSSDETQRRYCSAAFAISEDMFFRMRNSVASRDKILFEFIAVTDNLTLPNDDRLREMFHEYAYSESADEFLEQGKAELEASEREEQEQRKRIEQETAAFEDRRKKFFLGLQLGETQEQLEIDAPIQPIITQEADRFSRDPEPYDVLSFYGFENEEFTDEACRVLAQKEVYCPHGTGEEIRKFKGRVPKTIEDTAALLRDIRMKQCEFAAKKYLGNRAGKRELKRLTEVK